MSDYDLTVAVVAAADEDYDDIILENININVDNIIGVVVMSQVLREVREYRGS